MDFIRSAEQTARLSAAEYAALRHTIAVRGTARMLLAPASCLGWAALTAGLLGSNGSPARGLLSLAVLVAGFEAVHALHVGTERVGRYLQVYYEADPDGPRWETAAMLVGPALPGGGIDPLFSGVFVGATLINLWSTRLSTTVSTHLAAMALLHAVFVLRIVRARRAAARQRAVELESFKALQSRERARG